MAVDGPSTAIEGGGWTIDPLRAERIRAGRRGGMASPVRALYRGFTLYL